MVVEIGVSSIVLRLLTANKGVLSEGFVIFLKSARRADNVCFDSKFISLCDL